MFCFIPYGVVACSYFGSVCEDDFYIFESEVFIDGEEEVTEEGSFLGDMVFCTEDVGVILGEGAHPHDSVEGTCGFISVAGAEF